MLQERRAASGSAAGALQVAEAAVALLRAVQDRCSRQEAAVARYGNPKGSFGGQEAVGAWS